MTLRTISITIDSLVSLFRDYLPEGDIPTDAQAVQLRLKPTERGRLAIICESDEWQRGLAPLQIKFDVRRMFSVG
jgi:hypothetical protein